MPEINNGNSDKIDRIYHIIEFEISNANNQISLSKKDNINFILLLFALIGFFAFIPADTFFYHWISSGIWMIFILSACIGGISCFFYHYIYKGDFSNQIALNGRDDEKCNLCDSSTTCKNVDDPIKKEKIWNYTLSVFLENVSLIFTAAIYTSIFIFLCSLIPYFYYTVSKEIASSFRNDSLLSFLLILISLAFIILFFRHNSLIKKEDLKKYLTEMAIISFFIAGCAGIIIIYGYVAQVPPFISISETSQFSSTLIEHIKIIPSVPLTYIVSLYTLVIGLVLIEYFFASRYIEKIDQKLAELLILKNRIDRYNLGISPELHIEEIIKKVSKLKILPPSYIIAGGIVTIPVPFSMSPCEELYYSAIENYSEVVQEISDE
jgi:hypothetical protein